MDKASYKTSVGTDNMLRPRKEPGIVLKDRDKGIDRNTQLCALRSHSGISKSIKTSNSSYLEKIKSAKEMSLNAGNSSKPCLLVNAVKNSPPFPFKHGLPSSSLPKKHEIGTKFRAEHSESNDHKLTARNSRQKSRLCATQELTATSPHSFTCKSESSRIRQGNVAGHSNLINLQGDGDSTSREDTRSKQVTGMTKHGISFDGESSSSSRGKKAIVSRPVPLKRNPYTLHGTSQPSSSKSKNFSIGGDKGNNTGSSSRVRLSIGGKAGTSNLLDANSVPSTQPPIPASHNRIGRALNSSSLLPHEFFAESSSRVAELLPHRSGGGHDDPFDFIEFGLSHRDRLYMGAVARMLREMERIEEVTGIPYETPTPSNVLERSPTLHNALQRPCSTTFVYSLQRPQSATFSYVLQRSSMLTNDSYQLQFQFLQEADTLLQGLSFRDQHRDMRMDIDNMSYEELLELEERMGTVSTALSEEEISGRVKMCTFQNTDSAVGAGKMVICEGEGDDVKCSICQEEYEDGEETGVLGCNHRFHVVCLHKWMKVKNWCPVCKASAK